jgi:hypothetical protein
MAFLTKEYILKAAAKSLCLVGADLQWDEPGKCIITLRDGLTWETKDDNSTTEGFIFEDVWHNGERDTVGYFNRKIEDIT